MWLNNTELSLLIITSAFLIIFLGLGIVVLVYTLKIQKELNKVARNIQSVTGRADKMTDVIEKSMPIIKILKFLTKDNRPRL